jgi:hypothetical protein
MIFTGSVLASIGATYLLISTAHLATAQHATRYMRLCWIGAVITFFDVSAKLLAIMKPALSAQGLLVLPAGRIDLYPVMISVALMIGYGAAVFAFPWRWAATSIALVRTAFTILFGLLVPPAMAWQIRVEHETLLPRVAQAKGSLAPDALTAILTIVLALVIDGVVWYGRQKHWSMPTLLRALFLASLPVLLIIAGVGLQTVHLLTAKQLAEGLTAQKLGIVVKLVSLLLVPVGAFLGQWCGQVLGQSMKSEVK